MNRFAKAWRTLTGAGTKERDASLPFDEWVDFFNFNSTTYPLLQTTWSNQGEEAAVRSAQAAYKANGPVFALVLARLQVFSQARFQWRRFENGRPTDLFGSAELAALERPWLGGTTADLLARMEQDVSLAGNSYTRRIRRRSAETGQRIDRLSRLRPEWVIIVLGSEEDAPHPSEASDVEVAGYLYKPPNGRMQVFGPTEVAHYAPIPDPDMTHLGMSWVTASLREVTADNSASIYKAKFFENAATPNLAIKFDPSVTVKQVREFKEILESEHAGAMNAFKTLYLGGGADPVTVGKDFRELEFRATQGAGETRLAADAGVPPIIAGFSEGLSSATYSNYGQARRRFADGTCQHLWQNASASLEVLFTPPEGAHLAHDTRHVPFLREDSKDEAEIFALRANAMRTLTDGGFDPATVTAAVDAMDVTLLKHTGLLPVQVQPPGSGVEDTPAEGDDES